MFSDFKIRRSHVKLWNEIIDLLKTICQTVVIVIVVFTFVARTAVVNGSSMEPTLMHGDLILIWSLGYKPKQGDIIACSSDGLKKVIIKRVIAIGGQLVDIDFSAGKVYVDGIEYLVPGIDNHTTDPESRLTYPLKVPEGKYFVMGDNRQHSTDSRSSAVGFVDRNDILGRALIRLLPVNRAGKLK